MPQTLCCDPATRAGPITAPQLSPSSPMIRARSSEPGVVKGAIALLKRRNPRTRVLVSVGGATYNGWNRLNATAIAAFVRVFGLDGVDVDYEGDGCESCTGWPLLPAMNERRQRRPCGPSVLAGLLRCVGAVGLDMA